MVVEHHIEAWHPDAKPRAGVAREGVEAAEWMQHLEAAEARVVGALAARVVCVLQVGLDGDQGLGDQLAYRLP